jgi:MFS transporter, DHA1 family, chloramphenicol resistance protein
VTSTAGLGELWLSAALVLFRACSFVGVTVAGRPSDHRPGLALAVGGPLLLIGWPALAMPAGQLCSPSCSSRVRCRSRWAAR